MPIHNLSPSVALCGCTIVVVIVRDIIDAFVVRIVGGDERVLVIHTRGIFFFINKGDDCVRVRNDLLSRVG